MNLSMANRAKAYEVGVYIQTMVKGLLHSQMDDMMLLHVGFMGALGKALFSNEWIPCISMIHSHKKRIAPTLLQLLHPLHCYPVRAKPVHIFQFLFLHPPEGRMFQDSQGSPCYVAQVAFHSEVKLGIVVVHGAQESVYFDISNQFFFDFPPKGCFRRFVFFYFAAGKFPVSFEFPIAPAGSKYFMILYNHRRCHMNGFHQDSPSPFFSKRYFCFTSGYFSWSTSDRNMAKGRA